MNRYSYIRLANLRQHMNSCSYIKTLMELLAGRFLVNDGANKWLGPAPGFESGRLLYSRDFLGGGGNFRGLATGFQVGPLFHHQARCG